MSLQAAGRRTVTLVVVCQAFHSLTFGGIALFLPLIRDDLGITFAQAGILSAAATLSYALGQIPAGYLSDRYGPKRLFFIGLMGWSLLSMTLGGIHWFWVAVVNQFLAGAFRALLFAPGLSLLASWFPAERRATAMSLYMVGGFTGNVLLSLTGPLLAANVGWRYAFMLYGALGVAAAVGYWSCAAEKPRKHGADHVGIGEAAKLLRHRILWVCSAIQFTRFGVVTAFAFWLPSLLVADRGFSLHTVGLITAMSAAFSAPANALGAYVSDRLHNPPLIIGASLAILAVSSVLLVTVQSTAALIAVIAIASVFVQFYFGPLFLVPVEVLGQRTAGLATGFSNFFANIGGLLTAFALGVVKDQSGTFMWGFIGIAVMCIAGMGLTLLLARMRNAALASQRARSAPAPLLQRAR